MRGLSSSLMNLFFFVIVFVLSVFSTSVPSFAEEFESVSCVVGNANALPGPGWRGFQAGRVPSLRVAKFSLSLDPGKTSADTQYLQLGLSVSVNQLREEAKTNSLLEINIEDKTDKEVEDLLLRFPSAKHFAVTMSLSPSRVQVRIEREKVHLTLRGQAPVDFNPFELNIPEEKFGLPYVFEDIAVLCFKDGGR